MSERNKTITPGRLYQDIETRLLADTRPSVYLEEIYQFPCFHQYPFNMLSHLKQVEQSPKYHPEGSVWNHTGLVVDEAAKRKHLSKNRQTFMWAALLHDVGKGPATRMKKGKITAYNHDRLGAAMAAEFLNCFTADNDLINGVTGLVRYHMQILYVAKNLHMAELEAMKQETDVREVALLGLCDRLGRTGSSYETEKENIRRFLQACGIWQEIYFN